MDCFANEVLVESGRVARSTYESPRAFVPAVRNIVACYLVAVLLLTAGILVHGGWPLRP